MEHFVASSHGHPHASLHKVRRQRQRGGGWGPQQRYGPKPLRLRSERTSGEGLATTTHPPPRWASPQRFGCRPATNFAPSVTTDQLYPCLPRQAIGIPPLESLRKRSHASSQASVRFGGSSLRSWSSCSIAHRGGVAPLLVTVVHSPTVLLHPRSRQLPGRVCPQQTLYRWENGELRRWLSHPNGASQTPGVGLPQQA